MWAREKDFVEMLLIEEGFVALPVFVLALRKDLMMVCVFYLIVVPESSQKKREGVSAHQQGKRSLLRRACSLRIPQTCERRS